MIDVSVIITCYNKESFLDECVSSVLSQTKLPKEIIVVHDGCSTPVHHAEALSIFLRVNEGVVNARHQGVRMSTGSLLLFLDGDDKLSPDYLEKMALTIHEGADIAYPDIYFWQPKGQISSLSIKPEEITPKLVHELKKVTIPVTSLMKKEVYESLQGFQDFPVLEDLDFFLRAMSKGYILKKSHTLLWYRQTSKSRNLRDISINKKTMARILSRFDITADKITQKGGENGESIL